MSYYMFKHSSLNYNDAVAKAREELRKEGFGVLTEIDVSATLKKKLDVDFRDYIILGVCNPPFAHKALLAESNIGVMLPCNVILQASPDGGTDISTIDPISAMGVVDNPALAEIARQIKNMLQRVVENI